MDLKKLLIQKQKNQKIGMMKKMENGKHQQFQIQNVKKLVVVNGNQDKFQIQNIKENGSDQKLRIHYILENGNQRKYLIQIILLIIIHIISQKYLQLGLNYGQ